MISDPRIQDGAAEALHVSETKFVSSRKPIHNFALRGLRFGRLKIRPSPTSGIVRKKSINRITGTSQGYHLMQTHQLD
jgi:hypothetical protein